jgi:hypothetical protein
MIRELLEVKESDSIDDLCERFGKFLGIDKPVPHEVFLRAVQDEDYAENLIISRNAPEFLQALFNDAETKIPETNKKIKNTALVVKAAKAFVSWGKSGFAVVDDATFEQREKSCLVCPNLVDPKTSLQKLVGSKLEKIKIGNKVCALCGCNVSKKMKLSSESCPEAHPEIKGMTRWSEPIRD